MTCNIPMHVINDLSSNFRYVVTPSPDSNSIISYKNFLLKNNVTTVIRLCDNAVKYDEEYLMSNGIKIVHIPLRDGDIPELDVIKQWLELIIIEKSGSGAIAVHCRAGLGRAPLFVCIGLVKIGKMDEIDAVNLVRENIKGALNIKQINFVCNDLKNVKFKYKNKESGCIIA
jgi:protein tyrosine phosphatase type 4A